MAASGRVEALFKGRQFDQEIIVLCVRWYLPYKLSTRDLVEMMVERGVILVHTTILRWVQHYVPEFEKCWNQYARPVGGSWRCDETYTKVKGRWTYLYRAVDKVGGTIDFYLSERRDVNAAKHFFRKAIKSVGVATSDHSRRLRGFTLCSSGTEVGRSVAETCPGAIEQVFKQHD